MLKRHLCLALAATLALGAAPAVGAAEATDDLTISATVENFCEIAVDDFTDMDMMATDWETYASSPSAVRVRCNLGTSYSVAPGFSENVDMRSDYPGLRSITNGEGYHVPYRLHQDESASTLWDMDAPITGTGSGGWNEHPAAISFYGRAKVVGGVYADTIPITVSY